MDNNTLLLCIMFGVCVLLFIMELISHRCINEDVVKLKKENVKKYKEFNWWFVKTTWIPTGLTLDNVTFHEFYLFVSLSIGALDFPLFPIKGFWLYCSDERFHSNSHYVFFRDSYYSRRNWAYASDVNIYYPGSLFRILPLYRYWAWLGLVLAIFNWIYHY